MDRQNTNGKKTLKKVERGWVISAAIVALLGISAGTIVLQNKSSQNQGQCKCYRFRLFFKRKEYTTTDTIKETERRVFYLKVDAKEELAKSICSYKKLILKIRLNLSINHMKNYQK